MRYLVWLGGLAMVMALAVFGNEAGAKDFRVAIDIGHSNSSPGAISARGVPEYNFNRNMVHLLLARLQKDPQFKGSFIVDDTGEKVSLSSRPAIAETRGADVFLSIHHDSVYPQQLSQWIYQGRRLDVCDEISGYAVFFSEFNGSPTESHRLANLIGREMRRGGLTPDLNHAGHGNRVLLDRSKGVYSFNGLVVLKDANIPAALVECGVIKNSIEEVKLCDPRQQQRIVEALYRALAAFAGTSR
jgi:N-acetylmuramoyl-L-alanine amidase